jgi:hypothetical protein
VNHVNLSAAANPVGELVDSKHYLEDVLGEEITAFGNLFGKFDSHVAWLVQTAGYRLARATVAFHTQRRFDPYNSNFTG